MLLPLPATPRKWRLVCFTLVGLMQTVVYAQAPGGTTTGEPQTRSSVEDVVINENWGEDFQIRAFGENPRLRVMFSAFANELRDDFRSDVFRFRPNAPWQRGSWKVPIAIELFGKISDVYLGDDVRNSLELMPDNRFLLKISVRLHDEFEERNFRLAVIRALLLDIMLTPYARQPGSLEGLDLSPPEWLVHGFDQVIEHRRGGRPSAIYDGVLKSGQMLKPADLFKVKDAESLDPVNYAIFRTSAAAMVEALLDQPEGDMGLQAVLGDLSRSGPDSVSGLLRQHFPSFREMEQGMEKWWVLQIATLGQQQSFEYMGWEETEKWLTEALIVRFDGKEEAEGNKKSGGLRDLFRRKPANEGEAYEGTLSQHVEFLGRTGAEDKLANCFTQIQNLKRTGFPLYRPVFDRYEVVIEKLATGNTKGIDEEIAEIEALRGQIRETVIRTGDYLNYFEATRAPQKSDAFDEYSRMRRQMERKPMPTRNDRISGFVDSVEREFR